MEKSGRNGLFGRGHEGDKARWLAYALSTVVLFCVLAALGLALLEPAPSRRALAFVLISPPALAALVLVYRGRLPLAARVAVYGIWLALTLGVSLNRGLQEPLALAYPVLILAAGLLLDMAAVWLLTGLTFLAALGLLAAQQGGVLPPLPPPPPAWLVLRVVLASLAVAALSSRVLINLRTRTAFPRTGAERLSHRVGEMAAREGLLQLVMENVPALIHYADRDFLCLFANQPFRRFFHPVGAQDQEHPLKELLGEENLAALRPFALAALTGKSATTRLRLSSPSGEMRSFDCTFVPDRDYTGRVRGYFGQMVDVTEKEQAEAELRRSEDKFSRMFHSAPIPIALASVDGHLLEINEAACQASGWLREALLGHSTVELGLWPSAQDREAWKEKLLKEGHYRNQELRLIVASGQPRWALVSSELISLPDGPAVLSFIVDVTERKRAEEAVAQANLHLEEGVRQRTAELEAANRELESFAYSVSHDLRAPLRSIDGFSHILLSDYGDRLDQEGQSHLRRIRRSAQRLGRLIDGLLELSRVSRREMRHEVVDLGRLAREILDDLSGANTQTVDFQCHATCLAKGDPTLLRSLLENLLGNAWKYTSHTERPCIEFGCREQDGQKEYFVRDNGIGFDMVHAKKLFQPFERLHDASQFEGTGIGLATAARIVRRHGGEIRAESAPNQGATFFFTLV